MKILYISVLSSNALVSRLHKESGFDPGFAIQKFSRLIAKGFLKNDVEVHTLTNVPVNKEISNKRWINLKNEVEDGIYYTYLPFFNYSIVKSIFIFIQTFIYVLYWGIKFNNSFVFCDALVASSSSAALIASKMCGLKCIGLVTDVPNYVGTGKVNVTLLNRIRRGIQNIYLTHFTHYVLLTEDMNPVVNPFNKPYIVMECICDETIDDVYILNKQKSVPRVMLYAGGVYEIYGLKMLVEGFILANVENTRLVIYGNGKYVETLRELSEHNSNIVYGGIVPNEEIVEKEVEATVLVNPRFTTSDYTRYSFPSKNSEYMVSGTPVLTTKLPGMPTTYYPYVFLIEEETVEGYAKAIKNVFSHDDISLRNKGLSARQFVLREKNNKFQTKRILGLLECV